MSNIYYCVSVKNTTFEKKYSMVLSKMTERSDSKSLEMKVSKRGKPEKEERENMEHQLKLVNYVYNMQPKSDT